MRNALESLLHIPRPACDATEERLEDYLSGDLPEGAERDRVKQHLLNCVACREKAATYARLTNTLHALRDAPLPERPGDWSAVRARLEGVTPASEPEPERPRRSFWNVRTVGVGFAAVAAGFSAVALPTLNPAAHTASNPAEATPPPAPEPPRVVGELPPPEVPPLEARVMGRVKVGTGPNTFAATPLFVGAMPGKVEPFAIDIGNAGTEADAVVEVQASGALAVAGNVYRQKIRVAADGQTRVFVYPTVHRGYGTMTTSVLTNWLVTLTAPGRRQQVSFATPPGYVDAVRAIAYVGKRFGAITPRPDPTLTQAQRDRQIVQYFPAYVAPENAPNRAIGYDGFRLLVLSPDARNLNAAQWRAIRQYVLSGGRLLLTGDALLDAPGLADLLPVRRDATGRTIIAPGVGGLSTGTPPRPDGTYDSAVFHARRYGQGTVAHTSYDPAADPSFRRWRDADNFWKRLTENEYFGESANNRVDPDRVYQQSLAREIEQPGDPFRITFPTVQQVTLVFVGYFLLVVPVSFVVLKHRRRLHQTWVTGPTLALVVAGGICLLTYRLYFAPTARRTYGTAYLQSGEPFARFAGQTEFFFPRAGTYDLTFRGADWLQPRIGADDQTFAVETVGDPARDTTDARVSVGNLTFRRVVHQNAVTLPGAVTVVLNPDGAGGFVGYADNATGLPLRDVALEKEYFARDPRPRYDHSFTRSSQYYTLGDLPAGRTALRLRPENWVTARKWTENGAYTAYYEHMTMRTRAAHAYYRETGEPMYTLLAQTSGAAFGPAQGRDFSGDRSILVKVTVTPGAAAVTATAAREGAKQ